MAPPRTRRRARLASWRVATTEREARRFQTGERAVSKTADHCHRIINGHACFPAASDSDRTLFHKSFRSCTDFAEFTDQIAPKIDNVRTDVAERTRTGGFRLQSPDERKFWIDNPILRVTRAKMTNAIA